MSKKRQSQADLIQAIQAAANRLGWEMVESSTFSHLIGEKEELDSVGNVKRLDLSDAEIYMVMDLRFARKYEDKYFQ
jgi:hypothetical protein